MANEYERHLQERKQAGPKRRGLSNFRLKVIGAVLMFFSAASMTLVPMVVGVPSGDNMVALTCVVVSEAISWIAIPIYAWLLYSGFDHTRSWLRYGIQLFVLAVVCEVPYDLCNSHQWFDLQSQNPVFGLLIALIVLVLLEAIADYARGPRIALTVLLVAVGLVWGFVFRIGQTQAFLNIGMLTLGFTLVFYYLGKRENTMIFTAAVLGAVCMITPGLGVAFLHYRNDELGYRHAWTKWAFYVAYPVILAVCALAVM